jgi:DNA invertase Pin-like site-specific DNA recombinase
MNLAKPLMPKNPNGPLRVITIGRVSRETQNIENCDAASLDIQKHLRDAYKGAIELREFGEQGSGMLASREKIDEAKELIASREWDVVILEDLSRAYRNPRLQWGFLQLCADHDTRCICIADNIDTADERWETMAHVAALRHGMQVPDTRRRVRRTASYAFEKGGMVQKLRFGWRKLSEEQADSGQFGPVGLRMAKIAEHSPIFRAIRDQIVTQNWSGERVARWLNEQGVLPGPHAKSGKWTGVLVLKLLRCPLVSGRRTFRVKLNKLVYETGKYLRVPNPQGPDGSWHGQGGPKHAR